MASLSCSCQRSGSACSGSFICCGGALDQQLVELLLVRDVRVEGGRPGAELLGDLAHRDRVVPVVDDQPHRRVDDPLAGERLLRRTHGFRGADRLPGRLGHGTTVANTVLDRNSVRE